MHYEIATQDNKFNEHMKLILMHSLRSFIIYFSGLANIVSGLNMYWIVNLMSSFKSFQSHPLLRSPASLLSFCGMSVYAPKCSTGDGGPCSCSVMDTAEIFRSLTAVISRN